ncbi:hypothetical protein, partial [Planktotalea frisia]|uniref:hypothetical protein n=1 Tax=Planktotalea frisia TaxID=696762 RepID=UPI0011147F77
MSIPTTIILELNWIILELNCMSKFVFPKTARNLSPLSLLVLAACNGDSTTGDDPGGGGYQSLSFSGNVVKGP